MSCTRPRISFQTGVTAHTTITKTARNSRGKDEEGRLAAPHPTACEPAHQRVQAEREHQRQEDRQKHLVCHDQDDDGKRDQRRLQDRGPRHDYLYPTRLGTRLSGILCHASSHAPGTAGRKAPVRQASTTAERVPAPLPRNCTRRMICADGSVGHSKEGTPPLGREARPIARAGRRRRQRRAEADRARVRSALGCRRARDGPARGPAPAGVLLRHARSGALREGRRRPRPPGAEEGRRLGREAATGGPDAACRGSAASRPTWSSRWTPCRAASCARRR